MLKNTDKKKNIYNHTTEECYNRYNKEIFKY